MKILIEMCGGLGDEICLIPSYKALKEKYENCEIHAKVKFREILVLNPYIDKLIRHDGWVRRGDYDKVYVMKWAVGPYSYLANKHLIDINASQLGLEINDRSLWYRILDEDKKKINYEHIPKDKFKICFDTYSGAEVSRVNPELFVKSLEKIQKKYDCEIYQIGVKSKYHGLGRNLIKAFTVRELIAFINECDLCVSNNSGAFHLASMVNTSTLTFFTATDPKCYLHNENNYYIYPDIPCKGCLNNSPGYNPAVDHKMNCFIEHLLCHKKITQEIVEEKLKEIIEKEWKR